MSSVQPHRSGLPSWCTLVLLPARDRGIRKEQALLEFRERERLFPARGRQGDDLEGEVVGERPQAGVPFRLGAEGSVVGEPAADLIDRRRAEGHWHGRRRLGSSRRLSSSAMRSAYAITKLEE